MPSTFTTSGVELIADGEQSGLWGQTTNLNLQIIDRLTSQAGTITLSGTTHTLTVSDGVLSDGQYNVLVFAGTPSGTNTVTISPNTAQRTFFVRNTTAQSVVLSQGSGANATVLAGTARIVYTNGGGTGAAVFDITNTLAANTAATLQTARTIGGVSFDGSANINLPGVNQVGNQNTTGSAASLTTARTFTIGSTGKTFDGTANVAWTLSEIGVNNATLTLATSGIATGSQTFTANQGTNATFTVNVPATDLSVTGGTTAGPTINSSTGTNVTIPTASGTASGVVTTNAQTFAGVKTFSSTISGSVNGNAATATALQSARTIGGVSFDGTANINLPGVNQTGNQNTTGSAASLTTARTFTIGATGRTFDGTANVSWTTVEIGAVSQTSSTGAAVIPAGTDAQRPTPAAGQLRFNSTISKFEGYDGTAWGTVGGGGGFFKGENGSVGDATTGPGDIFRINEQELNTSVTISGTENASCTGPLAVASGVTLTVSAGGTLAVI
jgi:hypothetical protein